MKKLSEEEIIKVLKNHSQYTNAKVIDIETHKEYKVNEAIERDFRFIPKRKREK